MMDLLWPYLYFFVSCLHLLYPLLGFFLLRFTIKGALNHEPLGYVAVSFLITLLFFVQPAYYTYRWNQAQDLMKHGQRVMATVTRVNEMSWWAINWRSPWVVYATYHNPQNGQLYQYESNWVWRDPRPALVSRKDIGVYVDPKNPNRYYVDTSDLNRF